MNKLNTKVREVGQTLFPIILFVAFTIMAFVPTDAPVVWRFLIGAFLVFIGLSIFLWGVDMCLDPIGHYLAGEVATSKSLVRAMIIVFLMGFLVTVAEPDLLILGEQVESASGGALGARFLVTAVSTGVGVTVGLASLNLLMNRSYSRLMAGFYAIFAILALFASEEFLAIGFDSSGATTGALTTPFILSLSIGLARFKGGSDAESDSFGLVGAMSAGPILAVLLLSILSGQTNIQGEAQLMEMPDGIIAPIIDALGHTFLEAFISLAPIAAFFFIFNAFKFKISTRQLIAIIRGLIYTLIGLALFLVGANLGFMDMGRVIGLGLGNESQFLLLALGFLLGFVVVSAEPAVHVLGEQIEEVSHGAIPVRTIRLTLSIGVGLAVALSMLRITVPDLKLWHFLLPGFLIAIVLSFFVDKIFVGIAYDAGGVASGPMTATFVLAFAQGVAEQTPTANVLIDGFGIIAMVAMTPVLSIMILGMIFKVRQARQEQKLLQATPPASTLPAAELVKEMADADAHDLVVAIVEANVRERILEVARAAGVQGATLIEGRDARAKAWSAYSLDLQTEKTMIYFLTKADVSRKVVKAIHDSDILDNMTVTPQIFILPADSAAGLSSIGMETDLLANSPS